MHDVATRTEVAINQLPCVEKRLPHTKRIYMGFSSPYWQIARRGHRKRAFWLGSHHRMHRELDDTPKVCTLRFRKERRG